LEDSNDSEETLDDLEEDIKIMKVCPCWSTKCCLCSCCFVMLLWFLTVIVVSILVWKGYFKDTHCFTENDMLYCDLNVTFGLRVSSIAEEVKEQEELTMERLVCVGL
jgi:hypothetical protein